MSRRPQRLSASSTIALRSRSLVTSASNATAMPPVFSLSASIRPAVSFAEARLRSTHNTFAPSRAKVSAVARPLPMPSPGLWPAPTTIATLSFKRMSVHSRDRVQLEYLFVIWLVVDLHGGEHAHHAAIEGDGQHEVDHVLVREMLLALGKGRIRQHKHTHQHAHTKQKRLGLQHKQQKPTNKHRHLAGDVIVGDAELPT